MKKFFAKIAGKGAATPTSPKANAVKPKEVDEDKMEDEDKFQELGAVSDMPQPIKVRSIGSRYTMKQSLGKGRYGTVRICEENETGRQYAVKIINGKAMKNESIINEEVLKLQKVEHPNVVQFYDFFKDENNMFYIVMELCNGGDLFSRIVEDGSYNEMMCAELLRQLASALHFIHGLGITHRDLKPENILLSSKSLDACVKIVDFGLSKIVKDSNNLMQTVIGTWAYCAPEVFLNKPYDSSVDTWAMGILMFIMLSGYHPFDPYGELADGELIHRIQNTDFDFDEPEWEGISGEAKTLIRALLQKNPSKRMALDKFLEHPWVKSNTSKLDLSNQARKLDSFRNSSYAVDPQA